MNALTLAHRRLISMQLVIRAWTPDKLAASGLTRWMTPLDRDRTRALASSLSATGDDEHKY